MCRFTLYLGPPLRLSSLLLDPSHSLIRQSYQASERAEPLNGDGFGVGWYAPELSDEPAVFRSISPAWNNRNLTSLARVVSSPCILAHVRAATDGIAVSETNCHPFKHGRLLFMHNGGVGDFQKIRRPLLDSLCDEAFGLIEGTTDTEHVFAVVVDELLKADEAEGEVQLAYCVHRAVQRVTELVEIHGSGAPSDLNLAVSDGDHAVACRFTTATDRPPETLYLLVHQLYPPAAGDSPRRRARERSTSMVVTSERLTDEHDWVPVAPNHLISLVPDMPAKAWSMQRTGLVEATSPTGARTDPDRPKS